MSQHDALVALRHMLDHAREAIDLARGHSRAWEIVASDLPKLVQQIEQVLIVEGPRSS